MTGAKSKVTKVAEIVGITSDQFEAVGANACPAILQEVERAFVKRVGSDNKIDWWWRSLKGGRFEIDCENENAFLFLDKLVDGEEKVWFVVCDTERDSSKIWVFQGYIKPIQIIISLLPCFDYYIISKKYEWLVSENNNGKLIGLGSIVSKMQQYQKKSNIAWEGGASAFPAAVAVLTVALP